MALTINAYSKEFNPSMQDIHVIMPAPAASGFSVVFRILEEYGLTHNIRFVPDYRPGGDGIIALNHAYTQPADGNTLVFTIVSDPTRNLAHQHFQTRDFVPVASICNTPTYVIASPDFPANNLTELMSLIKTHPQKYTWAITQKSFETVLSSVSKHAGVKGDDLIIVRYNGKGNMAVTNIAGSQVDVGFISAAQSISLVTSKKLKLLGTWKPQDYAPWSVENLETVMGGDLGSLDALGVFMTSNNSLESQAYWKRFLNEFTSDPEIRQKLQNNFFRHPDYPIEKVYDYNIRQNSKFNVSIKMSGVTGHLTQRQEQIYGLIKQRGMSNKDIASTLNIGESAVKMHITEILKKFNVKNRSQLQAFG